MSSFTSRRLRVVVAAAVLLAALAGLGLWLRDSSLVRVNDVTVSGLQGRQAAEIRAALTAAALDMTTLDIDDAALRDAVATYPVVRSLRTTTDFPHRLRIVVSAYRPVAALQHAGAADRIAVAFDGTLLRGNSVMGLPVIGVKTTAGGTRVTDAATLHAIAVVAAAPSVLRARVERVYRDAHGLTATVDGGPKLYFGGGGEGLRPPSASPRRTRRARAAGGLTPLTATRSPSA